MLISGRQATTRLAGVGVAPRHGRRLLADGFAGAAMRTAGAHLYDEDQVMELAAWPILDKATIDSACPFGLFIGRRDVVVTSPREDLLHSAAAGWQLRPLDWMWLGFLIESHGFVPMVVTVAGFVAVGAEITNVWGRLRPEDPPGFRFVVREPGSWFAELGEHRLNLMSGGGSFTIWGFAPGAKVAGTPNPFPDWQTFPKRTRSRRARAARRLKDV